MTEEDKLVQDIMENVLPPNKRLFDTQDIMDLFDIKNRMTIYRWNNKGFIKYCRVGRKNFYRRRDVAEAMAKKMLEDQE